MNIVLTSVQKSKICPYMSEPRQKKMSLKEMALDVFKPDPKTGESRVVTKEEMVEAYPELDHQNGWSWGRYDSPLAREYELKRIPEKGPITAYQLLGFKKNQKIFKRIRADILSAVISNPCVVTGVNTNGENGRIECDHKNGRYDDLRVNETSTQSKLDFQPLHKNVNTIKREHCKRCKQTGKRFDAKVLGFTISWLQGEAEYSKENGGCIGCYWYDVRLFHSSLEKSEYKYDQKTPD